MRRPGFRGARRSLYVAPTGEEAYAFAPFCVDDMLGAWLIPATDEAPTLIHLQAAGAAAIAAEIAAVVAAL